MGKRFLGVKVGRDLHRVLTGAAVVGGAVLLGPAAAAVLPAAAVGAAPVVAGMAAGAIVSTVNGSNSKQILTSTIIGGAGGLCATGVSSIPQSMTGVKMVFAGTSGAAIGCMTDQNPVKTAMVAGVGAGINVTINPDTMFITNTAARATLETVVYSDIKAGITSVIDSVVNVTATHYAKALLNLCLDVNEHLSKQSSNDNEKTNEQQTHDGKVTKSLEQAHDTFKDLYDSNNKQLAKVDELNQQTLKSWIDHNLQLISGYNAGYNAGDNGIINNGGRDEKVKQLKQLGDEINSINNNNKVDRPLMRANLEKAKRQFIVKHNDIFSTDVKNGKVGIWEPGYLELVTKVKAADSSMKLLSIESLQLYNNYVEYRDTMGRLAEYYNENRMGKLVLIQYDADLVSGIETTRVEGDKAMDLYVEKIDKVKGVYPSNIYASGTNVKTTHVINPPSTVSLSSIGTDKQIVSSGPCVTEITTIKSAPDNQVLVTHEKHVDSNCKPPNCKTTVQLLRNPGESYVYCDPIIPNFTPLPQPPTSTSNSTVSTTPVIIKSIDMTVPQTMGSEVKQVNVVNKSHDYGTMHNNKTNDNLTWSTVKLAV